LLAACFVTILPGLAPLAPAAPTLPIWIFADAECGLTSADASAAGVSTTAHATMDNATLTHTRGDVPPVEAEEHVTGTGTGDADATSFSLVYTFQAACDLDENVTGLVANGLSGVGCKHGVQDVGTLGLVAPDEANRIFYDGYAVYSPSTNTHWWVGRGYSFQTGDRWGAIQLTDGAPLVFETTTIGSLSQTYPSDAVVRSGDNAEVFSSFFQDSAGVNTCSANAYSEYFIVM
jgi:hypothetical protein